MLKTSLGLLLLFLAFFTTTAFAQTDSIKRDSVKIDTNLLNKYRLEPRRNSIPLRLRPVTIQPEAIPVTMLDYKISHWRKWITVGINVAQSAFSSNWKGGGISSLALGGNFDYKTEYNKAPFNYTGELLMIYGSLSNKGQIARKTNDRLFFDNKVATHLSKTWFFFGSVTFESQFAKGYIYTDGSNKPLPNPILISKFMAPGYVTESLGLEYKPARYFDLRLGTGTAKQTLVLDDTVFRKQASAYGVLAGKHFKNELAFQIVATYDRDLMQNLHLSSRYNGFIPYGKGAANTPAAKNNFFTNIDHRLDVNISAKVNKLINVNLTGTALLDKDTDIGMQATEGLSLGAVYRFP